MSTVQVQSTLVPEGPRESCYNKGRYLIVFRSNRAEFWFEELDSLIDMVGLDPADVYDKKHTSLENPFLRCWFPNEEKVSL
mmetsp:Transcript_10292/g.12396  ORF Transcript_10292/g.12396 Transcript_10292/m.12396 type:complete len:81 (-) Transcript_10292:1580-1822(-)